MGKRIKPQRKKTAGGGGKKAVHGMRKEFVFIAVAVVLFAGVITISYLRNRDIHYNGDNVTLNFDPDSSVDISGVDSGDPLEMGDFTGESADIILDLPQDAVMFDPDSTLPEKVDSEDYIAGWYIKNGILYDLNGGSYGKASDYVSADGETIKSDGTVVDADGKAVGVIEQIGSQSERPTAERYAEMLVHYVCSIDDELFFEYLTTELRNGFGQYVGTEPYATLNGVQSFKVNDITDNTFSFTANSVKYTFEVSFAGDQVSGIRYVQ